MPDNPKTSNEQAPINAPSQFSGGQLEISFDSVLASDLTPQVALMGRIAEGWFAIKPIVLSVEYGQNGAIVSDDFVAMYGVGQTLPLAVEDYIQSLIEYYELLSERVSDDLANYKLLAYLSNFLRQDQPDNAHQNQTIKATA